LEELLLELLLVAAGLPLEELLVLALDELAGLAELLVLEELLVLDELLALDEPVAAWGLWVACPCWPPGLAMAGVTRTPSPTTTPAANTATLLRPVLISLIWLSR